MEVGSRVVAIFDFETTEPGELALKAGDEVDITSRINENWIAGTCNGKTGTFPANFVKPVDEASSNISEKKPTSYQVTAVQDYQSSTEGDLCFKTGDVISVSHQIDEHWLEGTLDGRSGIFPVSYVSKDISCTNQAEYEARATQNVTGQLSEELTFMIGDIITITGKVDDDWLKGRINGKSGVLPAICVQPLDTNSLNGPKTDGTTQGSDLNFDVLDKAFQGTSTTVGATGERPHAKTLFPFSAERDCELSFMDGETIYLRVRVDENWLEGELDGNVGLFPAEFVEILVDIPPGYVPPEAKSKNVSLKQGKASGNPVLSSSSTQGEVAVVKPQLLDVGQDKGVTPVKGRRGKVLYDFNPETEHDVSAKQGDIITIMSKPDNEWYEAKNPAGKVGFIPIAYVQLLEKPRTPSFKRPAPQPPGVKPSKKGTAPNVPKGGPSDNNANDLFSLDQLGTLDSRNTSAQPDNPKPSSGGGLDDLLFFDPLGGGTDPPLAPSKPGSHNPTLPHAFKPGGSTFKPVSFAGKSTANTATVAPMTAEIQSSSPAPPPQPNRGNSLLDMSPVDKPMSPVMMPMAPVDASNISSEPKPTMTKQESLDSLSKFDILAARPFNPTSSKQIRSVQRPVNRGSSSSSIDASAAIHSTAAMSGGSEPVVRDPELLTISQVNQDLDRAMLEGSSPNNSAGSGLLTLSQVNSDLDKVIQEGSQEMTPNFNAAFSSEMEAVNNVPLSFDQDDFRPPVPPRQPSPNPFAAAVEEQQAEMQPSKPQSSNPFSAVTPPGEVDNAFANSFDPLQSVPNATLPRDDSIPSDMSDDAFAQGINFTINSPLSIPQETPPTSTSFKLPPPPSPGKRPMAPPKPQKFDPRSAVPRPRPRSRSSVESIEADIPHPPPSQKPALPPKPDLDLLSDTQRAANPELANFEASIQQIFDTSKWETDEAEVPGQSAPVPPPPVTRGASLLDQDLGVISQVLQQHSSTSKGPSGQAAVGDLLGIGGVEETAPSQSKPSRPAPARPAMPAKKRVPPGRPVPPRLGPGMKTDQDGTSGAVNGEGHAAEAVANLQSKISQLKEEIETQRLQKSNLVRECAFVTVEKDKAELQQQIADEELAILEKEKQVKSLQDQLSELMPEPPPAPKMTPADFREKVVKELLKTEDDYVRDIKLCQEGFMTVLQENQMIISEILIAQAEEEMEELERSGEKKKAAKGLELDVLFGNMEQVIEVAESFLKEIEATAQKPVEDQLFGKIFMDQSRSLHEAYAQYCRNHDDASALLEKYEENPEVQEYINQGLELVRQSTNCWDLASFLIKPVQRILKYHLLIAELYKYTDEDHQDRSTLKLALTTMTEVATDINEFKRRKDLVLKYRHRGQEAITDKLGKINLHSLRKKSQRINQRFTQMTGLGTQTIDEEFDKAERRFHTLEKTIKIFVKDVHAYLEQLKEATSVEATVGSDISDYYANQSNLHEVNKYEAVQNHLANKLYKDYTLFVQQRVMSPLNSLLNMFQGPHKLIQKRYDKLLDYDSYINKAEKNKDKDRTKQSKHKKKDLDSDDDEVTTVGSPRRLKEKVSKESKHARLNDSTSEDEATTVGAPRRLKERHPREVKDEKEVARKNYEALNIQLKDELPRLCSMSMALFKSCVISFIEAERDHINSTLKRLYPLIELSIVKSTDMTDIMSDFESSHQEASEGMLIYSFVPRNFDRKVDKTDKKSKKPYTEPKVPASKPPSSKAQSESQRQSVLSRYPTGRVYQVKTNFIAQQPMDISVYKGNIVGIIKEQDPTGSSDRWYVDSGASQGFVPMGILAACNEGHSTNIYSSDDEAYRGPYSDLGSPQYYYAEWAFTATSPNELTLTEGAVVTVIAAQDTEGNSEWWLVEKDGDQGYVPSTYLAKV
ncbi:dynamin-binding protein-like isoform X2 [Lytechinus variegatus]|uniref:dynamin-binding protein-like isoform X2 n=1 Tax=Lytechinus variegatus TaxID=7654 RepID=UPI001BB15B33|nr:dynamin-binding protein-like isoform X2 [Lytechinus variegatus]